MIPDIFSSFDPHSFNYFVPLGPLFISINFIFIAYVLTSISGLSNRKLAIRAPILEIIFTQLQRTTSTNLKGVTAVITSLFACIITINLLGLVPYRFSTSRHLIFTLSFGLPLWLALIISSVTYNIKATTAHLLPDGAPEWLNPFLVLIESTRIAVRPITLSFRLAANISAGHIVLSLVGIYAAAAFSASVLSRCLFLLLTAGYILFEIAICLIQAYIFCLLLSLYRDDHAHKGA